MATHRRQGADGLLVHRARHELPACEDEVVKVTLVAVVIVIRRFFSFLVPVDGPQDVDPVEQAASKSISVKSPLRFSTLSEYGIPAAV